MGDPACNAVHISQAHCITEVIVKHDGITAEALHMALLTPHELQVPPQCLLRRMPLLSEYRPVCIQQ